jgi:hypothetical protein
MLFKRIGSLFGSKNREKRGRETMVVGLCVFFYGDPEESADEESRRCLLGREMDEVVEGAERHRDVVTWVENVRIS